MKKETVLLIVGFSLVSVIAYASFQLVRVSATSPLAGTTQVVDATVSQLDQTVAK